MALPNQVYEHLRRAQLPVEAVKAIVYMADRLYQLEKNCKEHALITDHLISLLARQNVVVDGMHARVQKLHKRTDAVDSESIEDETTHRINTNMGEVK